jgi:hypothetical protein
MLKDGEDDDLTQVEKIKKTLSEFGGELKEAFKTNFSVESIIAKLYEVDGEASRVTKQFGQGRENIIAIKAALGDSIVEVTKLGGAYSDIVNMQMAIAEDLGRNVIVSSDIYEKLYAATEVTGVGTKTLVSGFKDVGISAYQAAENMQEVVNYSRSVGVNAQQVSELVVNNLDSMNKYNFQGGVEGLAKMAAQATSLRFDMRQTLNFAEKVFNPEGAIETAAALQRLGAAQGDLLDPLRLMDLAQNDPTELQNQIVEMTKQFVTLNEKGQFEIMPGAKRQLREIEQAMGISYGELTKMALGASELEEKMNKISFPDLDISEDNKQLIANMSEMGKTGEFQVTFQDENKEKVTKVISELSKTDIDAIVKQQEEAPKTLEEIQGQQLSAIQVIQASVKSLEGRTGTALSGTKAGEDITGVAKDIYSNIADIFSEKGVFSVPELREHLGGGINDIMTSVADAIKGGGNIEDVFSTIGENLSGGLDYLAGEVKQGADNFISSINKMNESSNNYTSMIGGLVGNIIDIKGITPNSSETSGTATTTRTASESTNIMESKSTNDVNLNINVNSSNSSITPEQMKLIMQDQGVIETIIKQVTSAINNNGLTNENGGRMNVTTNVTVNK